MSLRHIAPLGEVCYTMSFCFYVMVLALLLPLLGE